MSLTPSKLRDNGVRYDFTLIPGETKEEQGSKGYAVRATRQGDIVYIYKRLATTNFYIHDKLSYNAYLAKLGQPLNKGSLIEAF
jgi:hypothetical protein